MTAAAKRWNFTSFEEEPPRYNETTMEYMCYQREIAPETKREHWQGFVIMKDKKHLSTMKKQVSATAHLESAKRTNEQCIAYCSKKETAIEETFKSFGSCFLAGGKPGAMWPTIKEQIANGAKIAQILDTFPTSSTCVKGIQALMHYTKKPPATRQVINLCLWGAPGVGKTKWIYDNFDEDDVYFKDKTEWWDGYDGEKVVVWDDFYGEHKVGAMLRFLDIYRAQGQVKGGYVWLRQTYNIFTSNEPPENWYSTVFSTQLDVKRAFQRRLPPCNVQEIRDGQEPNTLDAWDYQVLKRDNPAPTCSDLLQ